MLAQAQHYVDRGRAVVPIPHRSKNPGLDGWQNLRLTMEDLPQYFNCAPQNIGVLMGEPSGWLIDIDLDHPRAIELAEQQLPATLAVFGRPGKKRSHRIYRVSGPIKSKRIRSKTHGTIIELRSTGGQTVFPPSTHESGEPISWDHGDVEPPLIDPDVLMNLVEEIGRQVLEELGEPKVVKPRASRPTTSDAVADSRIARCLASMRRMKLTDQNDGSHRLFCAACRAVEHDLDDSQALACIHTYATEKPFPKGWTDQEILQRGVHRLLRAGQHLRRRVEAAEFLDLRLGCGLRRFGRLRRCRFLAALGLGRLLHGLRQWHAVGIARERCIRHGWRYGGFANFDWRCIGLLGLPRRRLAAGLLNVRGGGLRFLAGHVLAPVRMARGTMPRAFIASGQDMAASSSHFHRNSRFFEFPTIAPRFAQRYIRPRLTFAARRCTTLRRSRVSRHSGPRSQQTAHARGWSDERRRAPVANVGPYSRNLHPLASNGPATF